MDAREHRKDYLTPLYKYNYVNSGLINIWGFVHSRIWPGATEDVAGIRNSLWPQPHRLMRNDINYLNEVMTIISASKMF